MHAYAAVRGVTVTRLWGGQPRFADTSLKLIESTRFRPARRHVLPHTFAEPRQYVITVLGLAQAYRLGGL
jgi:hypothetical protein